MNESCFINKAYDYAIKTYINEKNNSSENFNSFFYVVIRLLSIVYDELDLLNPYYNNNQEELYNNLQKYGYIKENVDEFFRTLESFYEKENTEDFIKIQKQLISMFSLKKINLNLSDEEINRFKSLIYSPYSISKYMVDYNNKMTSNPLEVYYYCTEVLIQSVKHKEYKKMPETLSMDAYAVLKYTFEDIQRMTADELENTNKAVYAHFNINENTINKRYLLDKAVYELNKPKPAFSTGNGYIDILFIMSAVATLAMIIFIVTLAIK